MKTINAADELASEGKLGDSLKKFTEGDKYKLGKSILLGG